MSSIKKCLMPLIFIILLPVLLYGEKLSLTKQEKEFIKKHPIIRVHNEQDWAPYNFNKNSVPQGFSVDYINLLAKKAGLKIEYITGHTWNEFLIMLQKKEIDIIANMVKTDDRSKYSLFTEPHIKALPFIFSNKNKPPIRSLTDLRGKTVAIPKGFYYQEVIEKEYPEIKLILKKNSTESLKSVHFGESDACIGIGPVLDNLIVQNSLTNVTPTGEAIFKNFKERYVRIGVRKDWPAALSILQKAMNNVTYNEEQALINKWLFNYKKKSAKLTKKEKSFIELTREEKDFIKAHPVIRVQSEEDYPPFDFRVNNKEQGYSIDYLKLNFFPTTLFTEKIVSDGSVNLLSLALIPIYLGKLSSPKKTTDGNL